ncbi:glycosylase [Candidatus Uhrbacteria bacterium]|nr:glycosylase [Candidatus Uhrbacteria bacterium]
MFIWKKLGRVFNPQDVVGRPWMREFAQAPSTLIKGATVRVYFACRPPRDDDGNYISFSAFIDINRSNLLEIVRISERPILELGEPGTFDEFGTYFTSVTRKEDDVLAYYAGYTRSKSVPFTISIGAAISHDDGETFTKLGNGPILPCSVNEPFFLTVPRIKRFNNHWFLWYSAGKKWLAHNGRLEPVYQIRMATSNDALHWTKLDKNIIPIKLEDNECQACPDVIFYKNKYHMLFCYRYSTNFRGKDFGYRIGYAWSDNLLNWTRDDSQAGIDISEQGWDSEMVSFPHVFELDDNLYMLYLGNQFGRYGFGLAKLESYQD